MNAVVACLVRLEWFWSQTFSGVLENCRVEFKQFKSNGSNTLALLETAKWARGNIGNGDQCTLELLLLALENSVPLKDQKLFETVVKSKVVCERCGNVSTHSENHGVVILSPDGKMNSVVDNYVCEKCREMSNAQKLCTLSKGLDQEVAFVAISKTNPREKLDWISKKISSVVGLELQAFTVCTGGHHIAVIKVDDDEWTMINDESV